MIDDSRSEPSGCHGIVTEDYLMTKKKCAGACGEEKELFRFHKHHTTRDRRSTVCKMCHREDMRVKARARYYNIVKPAKGHKDRPKKADENG